MISTSIWPYIRHAVQYVEMDGGLVPLRFSKNQMAFFEPTPYKFRSFNAAGIVLDFMTDSSTLHLAYDIKLKPKTKELVYFDIYVDDRFVGYQGGAVDVKGSAEWEAALPIEKGNPKRVTVYLPYLARVVLKKFELEAGAVLEPAKSYEKNLLCLGDSITQGMNALHPSSTYAVLLSRQLRMNLLNQAVSGYVFNPDSIDPDLPFEPDHITVAYGTNDWSIRETLDELKQNAENYITKLAKLYPDVPITVFSPIWRDEIHNIQKTGKFRDVHAVLERICAQYTQVRYVDGLDLVPHHNDYFADGLHPTDEGFLHMALNILKRSDGQF